VCDPSISNEQLLDMPNDICETVLVQKTIKNAEILDVHSSSREYLCDSSNSNEKSSDMSNNIHDNNAGKNITDTK